MSYKAYFDGSCFLNDCGIGYVVRDPEGFSVCQVAEYGGRGDALKAEYLALTALIQRLISLKINQADIHGDSRTVVCQINGQINTREKNRFRQIIMSARRYFNDHPGWRLKWIPRKENGMADSLATEGLFTVKSCKQASRLKPKRLRLLKDIDMAA